MNEVPIGNAWRRAECLGDCGQVVKRSRDAFVTMVGTRSGSWIAALHPKAGTIYADTTDWPHDQPVFVFGVSHTDCGPQARHLLKSGTAKLPDQLPHAVAQTLSPDDPAVNLQIPTAASTCPFCEQNEKGGSDEDVFPKWLLRELVKRGARFKIGGLWSSKPVGPLTYACQDCNNTWMSTLENDVRPTMLRLFDNAFDLSREEQEALARWATMKAILADTMTGMPVVPRGFGRDLRIRQAPHEGVQVWIAAFHDEQPRLSLLPRLIYADPTSDDPEQVVAFCVTIVAFRLIVQVLIPFFPGNLARLDDLDGSVIEVWPNPREVLWPPPWYFDGEALEYFAVRIYDNREPVIKTITLRTTPVAPAEAPPADSDGKEL